MDGGGIRGRRGEQEEVREGELGLVCRIKEKVALKVALKVVMWCVLVG